jgi:peroxiredoxin
MGIVGLCVILLVCGLHWDSMAGRQVPDFTRDQAYGGRVYLTRYRDRPVLVVFGLTSCGIWRHEPPLRGQLRDDFSARGVEIPAVNIRDLNGAGEFMRDERLGLTSLADADGQAAEKYKWAACRSWVLTGPDGKIRRSAQDEQTLRDWVSNSGTGTG